MGGWLITEMKHVVTRWYPRRTYFELLRRPTEVPPHYPTKGYRAFHPVILVDITLHRSLELFSLFLTKCSYQLIVCLYFGMHLLISMSHISRHIPLFLVISHYKDIHMYQLDSIGSNPKFTILAALLSDDYIFCLFLYNENFCPNKLAYISDNSPP